PSSANTPSPPRSDATTRRPDGDGPSRSAPPVRTCIYGLTCPVTPSGVEVVGTSQPPGRTGQPLPLNHRIRVLSKSIGRTPRRNVKTGLGIDPSRRWRGGSFSFV